MKAKIQLPACYKKEAETYIAKLEAGMNRSTACVATLTARIAPTFGMADAMNGKEGRTTLFKELAGKASALLSNFCKIPRCIRLGKN